MSSRASASRLSAPPSVAAEMPPERLKPSAPLLGCVAAEAPPLDFPFLLVRSAPLPKPPASPGLGGFALPPPPPPFPTMQPPVVAVTDCSLFLCSFKQSKSAVRLKEDVKKIAAAAAPLSRRRATSWRRVFGVGLAELQQQGLSRDGIPTLVWEIVEYLTRHGLASEGLFRVNGNLKTVEHLRAKYENGEAVELPAEGDVSSAASLLKLFLRELPDGVITSALHPRFIQLYQGSSSHSSPRWMRWECCRNHTCGNLIPLETLPWIQPIELSRFILAMTP